MKFRSLLMSAVAAGALATTAALPMNVAQAADGNDVIAFTCNADLPHFGSPGGPYSDGSCGGTAAGIGEGALLPTGALNTSGFTYIEPPATCPALGSAFGTVYIAGQPEPFTWTRVGTVALIQLPDETAGVGLAAFAVTAPLGNPCNTHVSAIAAGVAVGIDA